MKTRPRLFGILLLALAPVAWAEDTTIQSKDINAGVPGSTTTVGEDGYDVVAGGRDIWFQNDSFRFIYCQLDGDFDVRVRVLEMKVTHEWAKAGLMARTALTPDAAQLTVAYTGRGITQIMHRPEKGENISGRQNSESFPGVVLRLVRKGGGITAYRTNTLDANKFEKCSDTLAMPPGPLFVGMAVCSHNEPQTTKVKFREFNMVVGPGTDPLAGVGGGEKTAANPGTASVRPPGTVAAGASVPPADDAPIARPANSGPRRPVDSATATALALAGAQMAEGGKIEQAREYFYKALANDPNCGEALYELGKLFEKDGHTMAAGDFFAQASRELLRVEAANPAAATKRKDADRRVLALNPAASQMRQALQDYADDLNAITRRLNDTLTHDEVADRVQQLQLERYVTAEKLPKTPNRTVAGGKTPSKPKPDDEGDGRAFRVTEMAAASPEIEKALKAAGWQTVAGKWKKLRDNVYEVSEGMLESKFKDGMMQISLHNTQTTKGSVRMLVRNGHNNNIISSFRSYQNGYGLSIDTTEAKMYIPYGMMGGRFMPIEDKSVKLTPAKNVFLVSVTGNLLEYSVNGNRVHRSNYDINKEGPFTLEINGTATIEMPQVKGN